MESADLKIRMLTNQSRGFYALLGPFLSRRTIAAELGGPIWDDDDLTWFVAIAGHEVAGFCALRQGGGKAELRSSYVLPAHRRKRVYAALFRARLDAIDRPSAVRSVVREDAAGMFRKHGFAVARYTKNFRVMEAELS